MRSWPRLKDIADPGFRRYLGELACLREAFVVSDSGVVVSARLVDASRALAALPCVPYPAAAYVCGCTETAAVAVSRDSVVRVFDAEDPLVIAPR